MSIKIISNGIRQDFAKKIANYLDAKIIDAELKTFANGEKYVRLQESVRRDDVYIISSVVETDECSLNDALMETFLIIDAVKRSSAQEITIILPYLPYSRQDRQAREREAVSSALILKFLKTAGADRILSIDLHSPQTQAIFDGPFDQISAYNLILEKIKELAKMKNCVIIAPDAGSVKKSSKYASELKLEVILLPKIRNNSGDISRPFGIFGVKGKKCIIIDDMIDSGGTIISAAESAIAAGAAEIICFATHGILSGNACNKIQKSPINKIIITNSLPQEENKKILKEKLEIIDIELLLAVAIKRIHNGESLIKI